MKEQKAALIGLILPLLTVEAIFLLVLLSLMNITVSSIIAADKLIPLAFGLSPVIYTSGSIVSIIALVKSELKVTAFVGVVVNIALLTFMLYFSESFLRDFGFLS